MKKGWEIKKLSDLCELITKGTTPTSLGFDFTIEGIKFIKVESLTESGKIIPNKVAYISQECHNSLKRSQLKENDILFSIAGALGRIGIVNKDILPANTNQALAIIRLKSGTNIKIDFLSRYFQSNIIKEEIEKLKGGAAQQNLSLTQLNNLCIPIPPLSVQKEIVSILDDAFESIERAKSNAKQNLKNAKELFESYLQNIFYNKNKDWKQKRLDEICILINGRAYNKEELLSQGKYLVLRVGNFFTNKNWYFSDLELPPNKYCQKGDLLYAWSASFGPRIWEGDKVIYHYHIWKVIPNIELVTKEFLFILLEWDKEKIKESQGTGTTMMHVSKGSMEERIVPLPPIAVQEYIVKSMASLEQETKRLESIYQQKLNNLEELKKSILQKAFNGELKTSKTSS